MTDRELLQQALDALEEARDAVAGWGSYASQYFQEKHNLEGDIDDCEAMIEELRARLAQPEPTSWEPKIWRQFGGDGKLEFQKIKRRPDSDWEDYYPIPEQREWQNCTDAALIEEVRKRGFQIKDAVIQREWQGLTDEEINYAWRMGEANISESNFEFCYRAIEAALKAKNGYSHD